jgi:hypothetical protein
MPEQLRVGLGNLGGFQGLLSTSVWRIPRNWRQVGVGCGGRVGGSPLDRQQQQARSGMGLFRNSAEVTNAPAYPPKSDHGNGHRGTPALCQNRTRPPQQEASAEVQHASFLGAERCGRGEQYLFVDQKNC